MTNETLFETTSSVKTLVSSMIKKCGPLAPHMIDQMEEEIPNDEGAL